MNASSADDSRIAQVLLGWGAVGQGQLQAALQEQARRAANGSRVRLGAILVEWGVASEREVRLAHSQASVCGGANAPTVDAGGKAAGPTKTPPRVPRGLPPADSEEVRAALAAPSTKRIGSYVVLRELGRGGMGVVFKAYDPRVERLVAIKQLIGMHEERHRRRFQREARLAGKLTHPGIATVYETGKVSGAPYLVMQLVSGCSLEERCEATKSQRLDVEEAARIVQGISEAMAYAHHERVLHRDLKPQNILVTKEGDPVVVDFGLARELDTTTASLTKTGQILGTYLYMAPEQARGEKDVVGPATDVYAIGAILYRCLTGRPPITGDNALEVVAGVLKRRPDPPSKLNPEVPQDLDRICLQCLEKDPARRYPNAGALAQDLARHVAGAAVLAKPRRTWRTEATVAGFAALVLGGSIAAVAPWRRSQRPAPPPPLAAPTERPDTSPRLDQDAPPPNDADVLFQDTFQAGLERWQDMGSGSWTTQDGTARFRGSGGKLVARGVSLPESYVLQFEARVTEHNPVGHHTDHLVTLGHIDEDGAGGFSAGLRQNDPNPTVRGWLYADAEGMRVGPYVMDDTLWHRFRFVKSARNLKLFVTFDESRVLNQAFDLALPLYAGGSFALAPSGGAYEFRDVSLRPLSSEEPTAEPLVPRSPLMIPVDGAWSNSSSGETTLSMDSGSFKLSAGPRYGVVTITRILRLQAPCKSLTAKIRGFRHSQFGHGEVHATLWRGERKIAHYYMHLGQREGAYKKKEEGPSDSYRINTSPDGSYSVTFDFEADRPEAVPPPDLRSANRLELSIQADTWVAGSSVAFRIGEFLAIPYD